MHSNIQQFQGFNDFVWFLCPIYGSQQEIPCNGTFMLCSIFEGYEEVYQLHF